MADTQLQYAQAGICVMDAKSGGVVFERNSKVAFAPASTQKIFTAIAAYEALGKDFLFQTHVGYNGVFISGKINGVTSTTLKGDIVIQGDGDPTFGSARYASSCADTVLRKIEKGIKNLGINAIEGDIVSIKDSFDMNPIPQDWMWGDMGNYYGAGHWSLNWNENQYDLFFNTGQYKDSLTDLLPVKGLNNISIINNVINGKKGTGDQSNIFLAPYSQFGIASGALEPNRNEFKVSGAHPNGEMYALENIRSFLSKTINIKGVLKSEPSLKYINGNHHIDSILTIYSPSIDSMVYWFLQKSINLYGEGFVKAIGLKKKGIASTEKGLEWIDSFYIANGFDIKAMHLRDGCGLSATNRVAPFALAKALCFAKSKSWFPTFYDAFPLKNNMKLKSGTIHRVKCFAGYCTAKNGKEYIVSLMVNNYNSSTSLLVEKMYGLLDILK